MIEQRPETMTTNLETERIRYRLLVASDVVNGKVTDIEFYVLARVKVREKRDGEDPEPKRSLDWNTDREELLARRYKVKRGDKVPEDAEEKYREYVKVLGEDGIRGEGPSRVQYLKRYYG